MTAEVVLIAGLVLAWLLLFGICRAAARGDQQHLEWRCPDYVEDE